MVIIIGYNLQIQGSVSKVISQSHELTDPTAVDRVDRIIGTQLLNELETWNVAIFALKF